jgi:hypothetical protein
MGFHSRRFLVLGHTDSEQGIDRLVQTVVDDSIIELPGDLEFPYGPLKASLNGLRRILPSLAEPRRENPL